MFFFAKACAWVVPFIMLCPIFRKLYDPEFSYDFYEYGTFVGGVAGPFAALAGFLYIYLTFIQQSEIHSEQKVDNWFFQLLKEYQNAALSVSYWESENDKGEKAFKSRLSRMVSWAEKEWPETKPGTDKGNNFMKEHGEEIIPRPEPWKVEEINFQIISYLIDVSNNEEHMGKYGRILKVILNFCLKYKKEEYFETLESGMGKYERIFIYYYLNSKFEQEQIKIFNEFQFATTLLDKHLDEFLKNPIKKNKNFFQTINSFEKVKN
ncbi:hypothetical protein KZP23_02185 [Echinicola marina]|uniref:hypothetical protein n=1 Tax=Echinicola marina TaxID=2859768 RepID=UPI001CF69D1F|nr:hypothetical protein [Echinicola marina]UCS93865.1 hypothetical protein KZP23_02185 [Echinicola marina]